MPTPPLSRPLPGPRAAPRRRVTRLAGPLLLAALATACTGGGGADGGGIVPDPPQVSLGIPDTNHYGTSFPITVSVTSCDQVSSVSLYDHDTFLTTLNYVAPPTKIDLKPNQLPYSRGIAADLSLVVKAICSDGRTGASFPVAAKFLPVADVLPGSSGGQAVPDAFYAEGTGAGTVFIGCGQDASGIRYLAKVGVNGTVIRTNSTLPFPCSAAATVSDKHPITGKRWLYEPGQGAMEYDSDLQISAWTTLPVKALSVGPDGDAVVWDDTPNTATIRRIRHGGGAGTAAVWTVPAQGKVVTAPLVNPDASVLVAAFAVGPGGVSGTFNVERLDYRNGSVVALYNLAPGNLIVGSSVLYPPAAFSPDGAILYIADQLTGNQSRVLACSTNSSPCNTSVSGSLKWTSPTLGGYAQLLLPYAKGSRIAAITTGHSYFLKQENGQIAGGAVDPDGAFVPYAVQQGMGRDFYVMNGSQSPTASSPGPLELVALDTAEAGPVYRYSLVAGSLTAAVADDGQVWLRINQDLVKPLPLNEYRVVR